MSDATRVGLVYVLLRVSDQHVKIGRSFEDAWTPRLSDLRRRYGHLEVMHLEKTPSPVAVERVAHKALAEWRRYGEFFEVSPDVGVDTVRQAAAKVEADRGAEGFASMQIRSVPLLVRRFFNDLAREHDCTLGELLTKIAEGEITIQPMASAASVVPPQIDALAQAAQAYELIQRASGAADPAPDCSQSDAGDCRRGAQDADTAGRASCAVAGRRERMMEQPRYKTWGEPYYAALARGHDHGSAAFIADQWETRHGKAVVVAGRVPRLSNAIPAAAGLANGRPRRKRGTTA